MRGRLVLLAVLTVAAGVILAGRCPRGAAGPARGAARVDRGSIRRTVSTDGRVASHQDLDIRCKAGGEVVRVPFDVGDRVKKGELLLELEPSAEERVVRQAEAGLRAAQARLAQARSKAELAARSTPSRRTAAEAGLRAAKARAADARDRAGHLARLVGKELVSQAETDAAEAAAVQAEAESAAAETRLLEAVSEFESAEFHRQEVRLAEAQEESARLEVSAARQRLAEVRITSPIAATVTRRNVSVGQVIPSAAAGAGTPVLTISDLSRTYVLASVDESDIGRVKEGAPAEMTLDAFPGERFSGKVVRIASRGTNVSSVVTFEVKVEVQGENRHLLRPEMTASVQLTSEERSGVLLVPAMALHSSGGKAWVQVVAKGGRLEERPVKAGISDGVVQEVLSGLSEGEMVAVEGGAGETARPARKKKFWNLSG